MGPRAGLDAVVKTEIPDSAGNQTPAVQTVAQSLYMVLN